MPSPTINTPPMIAPIGNPLCEGFFNAPSVEIDAPSLAVGVRVGGGEGAGSTKLEAG